MKRDPFQPKYRKIKPRRDKKFKDGRIRLTDKSELRKKVFERSEGRCEEQVGPDALPPIETEGYVLRTYFRCNKPISLGNMELSHRRHGPHRDDSEAGTIASCKDCHRAKHASKGIPRRPGKIMKIKDAQAYWEGNTCFCDGDKKPKESFCADCRLKLNAQTLYHLENSDDPDTYREILAQAEIEILGHNIGKS